MSEVLHPSFKRRLRVLLAVLRGRPVIYRWHFKEPVDLNGNENQGGLVVESIFGEAVE